MSLEGVPNADALAPLDLLVVKLRVGRENDLEMVRAVMRPPPFTSDELRAKLDATAMEEREVVRVCAWLEKIFGD